MTIDFEEGLSSSNLTTDIFLMKQIGSVYYWRHIWSVSASKHSGHSAAATETTTSASNEAYQELSTMPSAQPVYSGLER